MEDSINVTEVLEKKNQEILHNKKKNDLEKAMESLLLFFQNHSSNCAIDINNKICEYLNIETNNNTEEIVAAEINSKYITTFFEMSSTKLKEVIDKEIEKIEVKLDLPHDQYSNELMVMAANIKSEMTNYFSGNEEENKNVIDMLANAIIDSTSELDKTIDEDTKKKISKYLFDVITTKIVPVLNDNIYVYIGLIINNHAENEMVMDRINKKTINTK